MAEVDSFLGGWSIALCQESCSDRMCHDLDVWLPFISLLLNEWSYLLRMLDRICKAKSSALIGMLTTARIAGGKADLQRYRCSDQQHCHCLLGCISRRTLSCVSGKHTRNVEQTTQQRNSASIYLEQSMARYLHLESKLFSSKRTPTPCPRAEKGFLAPSP